MMLAGMIGIVGPIDMEMLALGQETHKYFTDDYDLFTKNEVHSFHVCCFNNGCLSQQLSVICMGGFHDHLILIHE
jgi:hypothetical protein